MLAYLFPAVIDNNPQSLSTKLSFVYFQRMGFNRILGTYKIIRRPGAQNFTLALAFQGAAISIIIRETGNHVVNTRTWVQDQNPICVVLLTLGYITVVINKQPRNLIGLK